MAILAVLGASIGGFLYTGMKQYQAASSEVSVQAEAQMAQNQIQNLLIDATQGVALPADSLNIYHKNADTGKKEKTVISYESADEKLKYAKYELDETNPVAVAWKVADGASDEPFAGYVTAFSVEMLDEAGTTLTVDKAGETIAQIKVHISYQLEQRKYESDFVVTPRNKIVVMDGQTGHDVF